MCPVCDLPGKHAQMEFEIEFARNADNPGHKIRRLACDMCSRISDILVRAKDPA